MWIPDLATARAFAATGLFLREKEKAKDFYFS